MQEDLVGNNVFDYIHPKDVAKVKEQLSCSDFGPRDKYTNSKFEFCYFIWYKYTGNYLVIIFTTAMLPVPAEMMNTLSKMCSGARRSFFCRMKCKAYDVKEEADTTSGSKYNQSGT